MDFCMISTRPGSKKGTIEIYPRFVIPTGKPSADLMIRGGDFYAVWLEESGSWSTNEGDALKAIDRELDLYFEKHKEAYAEYTVKILHMWDAQTGMIDVWHKYCQRQLRDSFHTLDEKLIFSNDKSKKEDYSSKRLSYPLAKGSIEAYDRLMSVLYSDTERHKIEWAIGAVVSGDSKQLQKFLVLYGEGGTGKGTVLSIIEKLFHGYTCTFEAKALGSSSASFALEAFRSNPLVAIQYDGNLSKIEDNTKLNSLVSHEPMLVNEKFKSQYTQSYKCFLFLGTNSPVRITDGRSGLLRRLIDVSPTGNKVPQKEYDRLFKQIDFELGAIAKHCLDVYLEDPSAYNGYIPLMMLGASNDFYNFMCENWDVFYKSDDTTLKAAYSLYLDYCQDANVSYPFQKRIFKEELKTYFRNYEQRHTMPNGDRIWNYYSGLRTEKFEQTAEAESPVVVDEDEPWLKFDKTISLFDALMADCPAQYEITTSKGTQPGVSWDDCKTVLKDLDTSRVHYVLTQKMNPKLIFVDFDLRDPETGEKSFALNYEAALKWPKTYAELSKSGNGIHLIYIYNGDASELQPIYSAGIEVKAASGKSAMRRKLVKCNDIPVQVIDSGLPIKEKKGENVLDEKVIKTERGLKKLLVRCLCKEFGSTTQNVLFMKKILDDAYNSGLVYDVSDMHSDIFEFALNSTNQSEKCASLVSEMKFKSEDDISNDHPKGKTGEELRLAFYDCEVFPNLFVICWKKAGKDKPVVRMMNPEPKDVEALFTNYDLVDFNGREYDRHICRARMMGHSVEQLFDLSQRIIVLGDKDAKSREAAKMGYIDILDFSSVKQSLKKFEIALGIHHQELGLDWNQPVPEELWDKVAEYCCNDVIAEEAVFFSKDRQADYKARLMMAAITGMTPNDKTNTLSTVFIFGSNRHPQNSFNYRFMGDEIQINLAATEEWITKIFGDQVIFDSYTVFDSLHRPIFPGYTYHLGVSRYRDIKVGEGGYNYFTEGMHYMVALLDIASMHPSSIIAEELFGPEYTPRFAEILHARLAIKHGDFDTARKLLDGKLAPYLTDESSADTLAQALKIVINSVYGLTAAKFDNQFHDPRNEDNIVAKRGGLFMINLRHEVERRGYTVVHIKTDSIKIANATPEIIDFVNSYGRLYGYTFEHEATYERMCIVDKSNYIAKYATVEKCCELYGAEYVNSSKEICKKNKKSPGKWTPTADTFTRPFVFKTLFSHEPIEFGDMCEVNTVKKGAIYLDMCEKLPIVKDEEKELAKAEAKYRKGEISDLIYDEIKSRLEPIIDTGHSYQFVGRVGQFCPILKGHGGGKLMNKRENGKYYAVNGTKGYMWMETEIVMQTGRQESIDTSYYIRMAEEAKAAIEKYGSFEAFVSDDIPLDAYMNVPVTADGVEEAPFA